MDRDKLNMVHNNVTKILSEDIKDEISKLNEDDKVDVMSGMIFVYMKGETNLDRYYNRLKKYIRDMNESNISFYSDDMFISYFNSLYIDEFEKEFRENTINKILNK